MSPDPSLEEIERWIIDQARGRTVPLLTTNAMPLALLEFDAAGLEQLTLDAEITWLLDLAAEPRLTPDTTLRAAAEWLQQAMQNR